MNGEFDLDDIRRVLRACREYEPGHHMHRPFMSAYQIAIRFAECYPTHPSVQNLPIGGAGTGEYQSLAQRLAQFLSSELSYNRNLDIEGGFLSHDSIQDLTFRDSGGELIRVSTLNSEAGHSIFRLR